MVRTAGRYQRLTHGTQDRCTLPVVSAIKWCKFVRNDDVWRLTKQPKLTTIIQFQSHPLTLFGYIARMDDTADAKRILLASPPADWGKTQDVPASRGSAPSNRI